MPRDFLAGQVRLLIKRCAIIIDRIDHWTVPDELATYTANLKQVVQGLQEQTNQLLADPDFAAAPLLKNHLDQFKRLVEAVEVLEFNPVALLDRYNERDHYFYRLASLFCSQSGYPYDSPLVDAHSTEYFAAQPLTNLIHVPAAEDEFFLALPDFVHELGHLFYAKRRREILGAFTSILSEYIEREKHKAIAASQSEAYQRHFDTLERVWLQRYLVEFACDIFATYLLGPAYGWSHLRLVISTGRQIYLPSFGDEETHPPDEARMRAVLAALEQLNSSHAVNAIRSKWTVFESAISASKDNEYDLCYPDAILAHVITVVLNSCQQAGLRSFQQTTTHQKNLSAIINAAWSKFLQDPTGYGSWEAGQIRALKKLFK